VKEGSFARNVGALAGTIEGDWEKLVSGSTAVWEVQAFDARQRSLAVTVQRPRITIERGLEGKK